MMYASAPANAIKEQLLIPRSVPMSEALHRSRCTDLPTLSLGLECAFT
jgi:hypothetical protein